MSETTKRRGIVCVFCGQGWGYEGDDPTDELIKEALDHESKCLRNPYIEEIERLKAMCALWKTVAKMNHRQLMAAVNPPKPGCLSATQGESGAENSNNSTREANK